MTGRATTGSRVIWRIRRFRLRGILARYAGRGNFDNIESLTGGAGEFGVRLPAARLPDEEAPSVVLDFGRELTGRVELVSDSDTPVTVTVQMGESESEAMKVPYLGTNLLTIAPHGTGHGPKTAFRYAKIRFVDGGPETALQGDSRGRYLLSGEV